MFELRVLSGLHQGAALPLTGDSWSIGADERHDLALFDPSLARSHFQLQCDADEAWQLEAREGQITDLEGRTHRQNPLRLHEPFALGDVWLCLVPAESAWPPVPVLATPEPAHQEEAPEPAAVEPARPRPSRLKRLVIACAVITIASSAWALTRQEPAASSVDGKSSSRGGIDPRVAASQQQAQRLAERQKLQKMLSDRMLDDAVHIEETPQGLQLKGALKGDALALYQRMLERARQQLPAGIALDDGVNAIQTSLPFVIVQVLTGPQAHIVTADGHHLFIGDELNGIRLVSIDDKQIEFDGAQHYQVKW